MAPGVVVDVTDQVQPEPAVPPVDDGMVAAHRAVLGVLDEWGVPADRRGSVVVGLAVGVAMARHAPAKARRLREVLYSLRNAGIGDDHFLEEMRGALEGVL